MITRCEVERAGTIELYFYGELGEAERIRLQQHLSRCATCREALDDLGSIRVALAAIDEVDAPPDGHWSAFMARLESAVHAVPAVQPTPPGRARRPSFWQPAMVSLAMAATIVLVTTTVLWVSGGPGRQEPAPVPTVGAPDTRPRDDVRSPDPALSAISGQHFARSKVVVMDLATRDMAAGDREDWRAERDLASSLLSDTRLYRIAAEDRGMTSLAGVMRDLELVLLEASMITEPDRGGLEQVQRLIRRRDLVTKMTAAHVDLFD